MFGIRYAVILRGRLVVHMNNRMQADGVAERLTEILSERVEVVPDHEMKLR